MYSQQENGSRNIRALNFTFFSQGDREQESVLLDRQSVNLFSKLTIIVRRHAPFESLSLVLALYAVQSYVPDAIYVISLPCSGLYSVDCISFLCAWI